MIIKRRRNRDFVVMPNNACRDSENLTLEAVGMLAYLLSRPADWEVNLAELQRRWGIGRDKCYRIMRELQAAGYAIVEQARENGGKFAESAWAIYDEPPCPENPDTAEPHTGHPHTDNPDAASLLSKKKDSHERKTKKERLKEQIIEVFDFWKEHHGKNANSKLDAKRERKIRDRLKDGYKVGHLKLAIRGCRLSPFHMGENPQNKKYNDIELICRDAPRVDQFIEMAENPPEKPKPQIAWPRTDQGWIDLGQQHGLPAKIGESFGQYIARLKYEIGGGA